MIDYEKDDYLIDKNKRTYMMLPPKLSLTLPPLMWFVPHLLVRYYALLYRMTGFRDGVNVYLLN